MYCMYRIVKSLNPKKTDLHVVHFLYALSISCILGVLSLNFGMRVM